MNALATPTDLAQTHGEWVDPTDEKTLRALEDASALFRSLANQTISLVEDDEVELSGTWERTLRLPERPVLDVTAVDIETDSGVVTFAEGDWRVARRGRLRLRYGCDWGGPEATVHLTYSHGFAETPGDVVAHGDLDSVSDASEPRERAPGVDRGPLRHMGVASHRRRGGRVHG